MQGFVLNIEKIKKIRKDVYIEKSFRGGSDGKESACSAGDPVPGSGRFSREGNGYPLQYSCWRIPWTEECSGLTVYGVAKSWTRLSN